MQRKIKFFDTPITPAQAARRFNVDFSWGVGTTFNQLEFGTIIGLYRNNFTSVDILYICNATPHNGHFERFMMALENLSRTCKLKIRLCCFINEKLYRHIKARAGWISPINTMDCLEYGHACPCIFCGAQPHVKEIAGLYYAKCAACANHDPHAFVGRTALLAATQWNHGNTPIGHQGAYKRKGKRIK